MSQACNDFTHRLISMFWFAGTWRTWVVMHRLIPSEHRWCDIDKAKWVTHVESFVLHFKLPSLNTCVVFFVFVEAEKVIGWARNHYLATCPEPLVKGGRLSLPRERYIHDCGFILWICNFFFVLSYCLFFCQALRFQLRG